MGDLSAHFSRYEFACKDSCGRDTVDIELLTVLEDLRAHFQGAVKILSGHRCVKHNKSVGGASNSQHLYGRAADIQVANASPHAVSTYLINTYPTKYGIGKYQTFTHIDTRTGKKARW